MEEEEEMMSMLPIHIKTNTTSEQISKNISTDGASDNGTEKKVDIAAKKTLSDFASTDPNSLSHPPEISNISPHTLEKISEMNPNMIINGTKYNHSSEISDVIKNLSNQLNKIKELSNQLMKDINSLNETSIWLNQNKNKIELLRAKEREGKCSEEEIKKLPELEESLKKAQIIHINWKINKLEIINAQIKDNLEVLPRGFTEIALETECKIKRLKEQLAVIQLARKQFTDNQLFTESKSNLISINTTLPPSPSIARGDIPLEQEMTTVNQLIPKMIENGNTSSKISSRPPQEIENFTPILSDSDIEISSFSNEEREIFNQIQEPQQGLSEIQKELNIHTPEIPIIQTSTPSTQENDALSDIKAKLINLTQIQNKIQNFKKNPPFKELDKNRKTQIKQLKKKFSSQKQKCEDEIQSEKKRLAVAEKRLAVAEGQLNLANQTIQPESANQTILTLTQFINLHTTDIKKNKVNLEQLKVNLEQLIENEKIEINKITEDYNSAVKAKEEEILDLRNQWYQAKKSNKDYRNKLKNNFFKNSLIAKGILFRLTWKIISIEDKKFFLEFPFIGKHDAEEFQKEKELVESLIGTGTKSLQEKSAAFNEAVKRLDKLEEFVKFAPVGNHAALVRTIAKYKSDIIAKGYIEHPEEKLLTLHNEITEMILSNKIDYTKEQEIKELLNKTISNMADFPKQKDRQKQSEYLTDLAKYYGILDSEGQNNYSYLAPPKKHPEMTIIDRFTRIQKEITSFQEDLKNHPDAQALNSYVENLNKSLTEQKENYNKINHTYFLNSTNNIFNGLAVNIENISDAIALLKSELNFQKTLKLLSTLENIRTDKLDQTQYQQAVKDMALSLNAESGKDITAILPDEFKNGEWNKKKEQAPNIQRSIRTFNKTYNFFMSQIIQKNTSEELARKHASKVIAFFIDVQTELLSGNSGIVDYNSAMIIKTALFGSSVTRLKKTNDLLTEKAKKQMNDNDMLLKNEINFKKMRAAMANEKKPVIPYLGMFLTDFTFAIEGNHTPESRNRECKKVTDSFIEIQKKIPLSSYQPFSFESILSEAVKYDENEIYNASLQIEPRGS